MRPELHIFAVRELTRYVKTLVERERALQGLLVRGEISACKYHSSGHLYFTMKDETSQLPCVMWADRVRELDFRCELGMRVLAEGNLTVYERGGNYQLSVAALQADGLGNLYLAFEQLKRKLDAEGLFAAERKRPLPAFPRCIALVTSPTGAVVHDFLTVSRRRWAGRHLLIVPTAVQGPQAPAAIVRALALAARQPDVEVIVVARGGGAPEELAAFNDERVARAIADSPRPVVSAIGHETDFTIADFVADLRAPTPSAAAELVVPDLAGVQGYARSLEARILARVRARLQADARTLARISAIPALRDPRRVLRERAQSVDFLWEQIFERVTMRLALANGRLREADGRLAALDPQSVLKRGFALVTRPADGTPVTTAEGARLEPSLLLNFADGALQVKSDG
jgi:exodeoxyribonuclease VII large subunit